MLGCNPNAEAARIKNRALNRTILPSVIQKLGGERKSNANALDGSLRSEADTRAGQGTSETGPKRTPSERRFNEKRRNSALQLNLFRDG